MIRLSSINSFLQKKKWRSLELFMSDLINLGKRYTNIFVSNIPPSLSDSLLTRLLTSCGSLRRWQRIRESDGKEKTFGFAEYETVDDLLRAIRIIPSINLAQFFDGKMTSDELNVKNALILKMDDNTSAYVKKWERWMKDRWSREKRKLDIELDRRAIEQIGSLLMIVDGQDASLENSKEIMREKEDDLKREFKQRLYEVEQKELEKERLYWNEIENMRNQEKEKCAFIAERLKMLSEYDDDLANDLYHVNREQWREQRKEMINSERLNVDENSSNDGLIDSEKFSQEKDTIETVKCPKNESLNIADSIDSSKIFTGTSATNTNTGKEIIASKNNRVENSQDIEINSTETVDNPSNCNEANYVESKLNINISIRPIRDKPVLAFQQDSHLSMEEMYSKKINFSLHSQTMPNTELYSWIRQKLIDIVGFEESMLINHVYECISNDGISCVDLCNSLRTALDSDAEKFVYELYVRIEEER